MVSLLAAGMMVSEGLVSPTWAGGDEALAPVPEYHLKAAFLFNLAKFVEWDSTATGELTIGVLAPDVLETTLRAVVEGKRLGGRAVTVLLFAEPDAVKPCDLLFIDDPHWTETQAIVQDLAGKGSLIVGESSAVLDQGGMVALTLAGKRIRIEINLEATDAAGLSLDSRLLKVAHVLDQ